jgi:DNA-binding LacI/PurR family transcriptional regulator
MSEYINPPLTTVRHPRREMGNEAVTLLVKKMVNVKEILNSNNLKNILVLRKSTAKLSK